MTLLSVRSEMRCAVSAPFAMHSVRYALSFTMRLKFSRTGGEFFYNSLADLCFEVAVALALKLALDLVERSSGAAGINGHQVVDAVLALAVSDNSFGVRDRALELLHNNRGLVKNRDGSLRVRVGFRHLLIRVLQRHYSRADLAYKRLGNGDVLPYMPLKRSAMLRVISRCCF